MRRIFLTDKEVAAILEISPSTLSRKVKHFRGKWKVTEAILAIPGMRRWNVSTLANALGMSAEELLQKLN